MDFNLIRVWTSLERGWYRTNPYSIAKLIRVWIFKLRGFEPWERPVFKYIVPRQSLDNRRVTIFRGPRLPEVRLLNTSTTKQSLAGNVSYCGPRPHAYSSMRLVCRRRF